MQTIQASVNPRLLTKASRLFTGTRDGRLIEILQNARRAGAGQVVIDNHDGLVTVRDNGKGVDDFATLLDLGGSDWEERLESSEDPAGVELFGLAPREVCIRSNGRMATVREDGWTGESVGVSTDSKPRPGTILEFEDEPWSKDAVEPYAVFTGLEVIVDHQRCDRAPFVGEHAEHHPELGCRIEIREHAALHPWHESCIPGGYHSHNALVNFHGQVVGFEYHPVSEHHLHYLVDLTGEPTSIRLMLPARTRLVENGAFTQLKDALQLAAFRYLLRRGRHRLPYSEYLYARRRGIELPEATPTFQVGLLSSCDPPEPVEVKTPEGFPLAGCYRLDPRAPERAETDEANVHLLAALGQFDEPFVPVDIQQKYDGYSWAKLPTIGRVEVRSGSQLQSAGVWSGTLTCVDSLAITVHTSDGRVFSSPVCMALAPPPEQAPSWADDQVLVTREAEQRIRAWEIWHHLGGWWDEGDTIETQEAQFEQELSRFWTSLRGPDEQLRRDLLQVLAGTTPKWRRVSIHADGEVRIRFQDQSARIIRPPHQTG